MELKGVLSGLKPINTKNKRLTFSKSDIHKDPPDLLNVQIAIIQRFLTGGCSYQ